MQITFDHVMEEYNVFIHTHFHLPVIQLKGLHLYCSVMEPFHFYSPLHHQISGPPAD